jgi:hypothetical protein
MRPPGPDYRGAAPSVFLLAFAAPGITLYYQLNPHSLADLFLGRVVKRRNLGGCRAMNDLFQSRMIACLKLINWMGDEASRKQRRLEACVRVAGSLHESKNTK